MSEKLRFRDSFHVESLESETVFLLSERSAYLLKQPLEQLLAPFINGQLSADEIVDSLLSQLLASAAPQETLQTVVQESTPLYYTLMRMQQDGHVIGHDNPLPDQLKVFCDTLNLKSAETYQRLMTTRVAVKALGSVDVSPLIAILEASQIKIANTGDKADLEIVLTDDYLHEELSDYNRDALNSKRPWMLVKPSGTIVWIGPIFYPNKTGCWECLANRLRANRPIETYLHRHKGTAIPLSLPTATAPPTLHTAMGIAATEILKWVVQGKKNKSLQGSLFTFDTLSLKNKLHTLVRRPQCPCCGDPDLNRQVSPLVLGNRQKAFTADGGHRCVPPEETLKKYQHHMSPITGIIRKMESIAPPATRSIHSYVVRHHFARMFDDLEALSQNLGGRSSGKGKTAQQAKASGLGEAIERYSGVFQGDEPRLKKTYQAFEKKAIHPNTCMNFSQAQYDTRQAWNEQCQGLFQKVPDPFDETEEIEWTPIWSLSEQTFKYLPTAYCYFGYPKPPHPSCWADANGCAAGNTLEEAILHGFMELVERDSVAMWWYNRLQKPQVDLDSFDDPYFLALRDYYRTLQRELWVLDVTNDLGIPTFTAVSRRTDRSVEDIVLGFGTHFDAKIAISRALTELSQVLAAVLYVSMDGSTQYPASADPLAVKWWKTATIENQPYLVPDDNAVPKVSSDYARTWSDNLLDDVNACQRIVEAKGMEMLVLDQTRPDVGLKVAKVVVPGLRHVWKRLGAGRLYSVPAEMGWIPQPLEEEQLNPFPMWM